MARTYRGDVSKLILLTGQNLSQDTAHDLSTSSLGHVGNDVHGLGSSEGTDALADLDDELLAQSLRGLDALLEGNEGVDSLASELISDTDDSSLSHGVVLEKGSLDLGGGETVTADVDDIVDTSTDPVESLVVSGSTVTGEVVALVHAEVGLLVSLVGAPDSSGHAGPGLLEAEDTLAVVSCNLLTADGVDESGLDAKEGQRGGTGLGRSDTSQGSDDVGAGLGLPIGIDDVSLLLTDNLIVPLPDLGSDGLTDGSKDSEILHLASDVLITGTLEQSQGSGGDVELSDLVLLDDVPVS